MWQLLYDTCFTETFNALGLPYNFPNIFLDILLRCAVNYYDRACCISLSCLKIPNIVVVHLLVSPANAMGSLYNGSSSQLL